MGCDNKYTELIGIDADQTLVKKLSPCVDRIRDLYTKLGARAYEVLLITTRWTGGKRGVGVEEIHNTKKLLPTPKVSDLKELDSLLTAIGARETGGVLVNQISSNYTEDELKGIGTQDDENFYWEIRQMSSGSTIRRRFLPDTAPNYNPLKFEWSVRLTKAVENRLRSGEVGA